MIKLAKSNSKQFIRQGLQFKIYRKLYSNLL